MRQLKVGDFARCRHGIPGLILSMRAYHDGDGIIRYRYIGISVGENFSKPWESIDPEYIGNIDEAIQSMEYQRKIEKASELFESLSDLY